MEHYLKQIIALERKPYSLVKLKEISDTLQIAPASVTEMVQKLAQKQYLSYFPYKGVQLTQKGRGSGIALIRRHRLWETYLHRALKIPLQDLHEEAKRLDAKSSDLVIEQMEKELHYPQYDPHGDPIPSKEGLFPKIRGGFPLVQARAQSWVEIVRFVTQERAFFDYIAQWQLTLYQQLWVKAIDPQCNIVVVEKEKKQLSLNAAAIRPLFVSTLPQKTQ